VTQESVELELALAVDTLEYEVFKRYYRLDPAGFVEDCIDWDRAHARPTRYQLESLDDMVRYGRESVRALHGAGKTAPASWATLWFAITRDGQDWKAPTTASVWRQLQRFLWPEVHKWHRLLRWDRIGRAPFAEKRELLDLAIQTETGAAFAVASKQPADLEGAHADHILYVVDEGKSVPDSVYDAIEGAFAGAGKDTGMEAFALNYSTPGAPAGRFYAIQSRRPGFEHWHVRHVTLEEAVDAGRVSAQWAETMRRQWGQDSPMYQQRVLGNFSSDEDSVIALDWVEAANERWLELAGARGRVQVVGQATALGVDVGGGSAETVFARRYGAVLSEIETDTRRDEMQIAGRIVALTDAEGGVPVVDVIGIGSGVVARLRELKRSVMGFNAGESAGNLTDRSGKLRFANRRSAAWWGMRERLHPELGDRIALPPDDMLTADLVTPRWSETSSGRILIEPKDEIAGRLGGRSTDRGDAVVQAFALELLEHLDRPRARRARVGLGVRSVAPQK
jgi:hypothetical protein